MLAHEDLDSATEDDVIVQPNPQLFPGGLVVQTGIRGDIWEIQCGDYLGELEERDWNRIRSVVTAPETEQIDSEITPLSQEILDFKREELKTLQNLSGDCMDVFFDEGDDWHFDPEIFAPDIVGSSEDIGTILAEAMHIVLTRNVVITESDRERLHQIGALDIAKWQEVVEKWETPNIPSRIVDGIAHFVNAAREIAPEPGQRDYSIKDKSHIPFRNPEASPVYANTYKRLITVPLLWTDAGQNLLNIASNVELGKEGTFDVMLLATPGDTTSVSVKESRGI